MRNTIENTAQNTGPWHKHFWPWFIVVLMFISVTTSAGFAFIAIKNADKVIDEDYYQHGLDINKSLSDGPESSPSSPKNAEH